MGITDTIDIAATSDEVWALTVDVERWPAMTPTVTSVEKLGEESLGLGSQARIKQPGMPRAVWTVTDFEPGRLFAWETKLATVSLRGIHRIEPTRTGCRNTLAIEMSGLGSGILRAVGRRRLKATIATENRGFKKTAEGDGASRD
jgi:hypothetical protein